MPHGSERGVEGLLAHRRRARHPGFGRGRKLHKVGLAAQDTAELVFEDARVPAGNLLGTEGRGFVHLMEYPIGRAYVDARIQTIYGGTTEIMKEIIGRDIAAGYA